MGERPSPCSRGRQLLWPPRSSPLPQPLKLCLLPHLWVQEKELERETVKRGEFRSLCLPLMGEGCPGERQVSSRARGTGSRAEAQGPDQRHRVQSRGSGLRAQKDAQEIKGGIGCPGAPGGCELPPREVGSLPISRWPWRSLESVGTSDLPGQGEGHTTLQPGPLEVMGGKGRQLRDAHPHVCISAGDGIRNRAGRPRLLETSRRTAGRHSALPSSRPCT